MTVLDFPTADRKAHAVAQRTRKLLTCWRDPLTIIKEDEDWRDEDVYNLFDIEALFHEMGAIMLESDYYERERLYKNMKKAWIP